MPVAKPIKRHLESTASIDSIVSAVCEIATTLVQAAERGVYHRDIKPSNLYMHEGQACVGDFGLAVIPDRAALTSDGQKLGPMWYLAPEMLNEATDSDPAAADVYSLAKTLWVLASGQHYPFPGEMSHQSQRLANYSGDARTTFLDNLIWRCCSNDPAVRPKMLAVATELKSFLEIRDVPTSLTDSAALKSRFMMVRESQSDVERKHKELDALRQELRQRFEKNAEFLVERARNETGLKVRLSHENHIAPLLPSPNLKLSRASIATFVLTVDPGRPLGADQLQLFGGFCIFFTHGREVALYSAFGYRGPEKILFAQQSEQLQLGTAELELALRDHEGWALSTLPTALGVFADALEKRNLQVWDIERN
jgi:serine/threonine protein kinase